MLDHLSQLPAELQQRIQICLQAGAYKNETEVLSEALDALEQRDREQLAEWNRRNRLSIEQSQAGLSKPLDLNQVLENVERRAAVQAQAR